LSKMMQGLSGRQKAAILLITLGPEVSAQIFKHLREEEIEQLTLEIANVRKVDSMDRETILAEFHQICMAQEYITQGGITYAKDILEKALGEQKALEVINRLTATLQVRPFDFARKAEPAQILNFIQTRMPRRSRWSCRICKPSNPRIFCRRCLRRNKPRWRGELR
jgi:flagellar motor switch protein FliG